MDDGEAAFTTIDMDDPVKKPSTPDPLGASHMPTSPPPSPTPQPHRPRPPSSAVVKSPFDPLPTTTFRTSNSSFSSAPTVSVPVAARLSQSSKRSSLALHRMSITPDAVYAFKSEKTERGMDDSRAAYKELRMQLDKTDACPAGEVKGQRHAWKRAYGRMDICRMTLCFPCACVWWTCGNSMDVCCGGRPESWDTCLCVRPSGTRTCTRCQLDYERVLHTR